MTAPRLTVLMPMCNSARYLRQAIRSILEQSFRAFEFLIIDDGSSDASVQIVESFQDERIRLLRNAPLPREPPAPRGIAATLNKGIAAASCELIAIMDPGCISHPERLARQFTYMTRKPQCALLSTWARAINDAGRLEVIDRCSIGEGYYYLTFACCMDPSTVMLRKSAVQDVGMYDGTTHELFWRLSTRFRISNLSEVLLDYRCPHGARRSIPYEPAVVLRNVRFYLGDRFRMSRPSLECLRHNFKPLLDRYERRQVFEALSTLNLLTAKMIARKNPNRDAGFIRRARDRKRRFMLRSISDALPFGEAVCLLIRTRSWTLLARRIRGVVSRRLKQVFTLSQEVRTTAIGNS